MRYFIALSLVLVQIFALLGCAGGGTSSTGDPVDLQLTVINSLSPNQGKSGDQVELKGQGFDLDHITQVRFGTVAALVVGVNSAKTSMTLLVPAQSELPSAPLDVTIHGAAGELAKKSAAFTYSSQIDCQAGGAAPTINNIAAVNLLSEQNIVVSGYAFAGNVVVNLQSVPLEVVTASSSNIQITATVPANIDILCQQEFPCTLPLYVANPNGCAAQADVIFQKVGMAVEKVYNSTISASQFGTAIVPLGSDADGDQLPDFAVLSSKDVSLQSSRLDSNNTTLWQRNLTAICPAGVNTTLAFESQMIHAGDPDLDGVDDFLIYQRGTNIASKHFCLVSADASKSDAFSIPNGYGARGTAVARIKDIDGDGRVDFLVGRDFENNGGALFGSVDILSGKNFYDGNSSNSGVPIKTFAVPSSEFPYGFGSAVTNLQDVDGDGSQEFLISAYQYQVRGALFVYSAATIQSTLNNANNPAYLKVVTPPNGPNPDFRFGTVVTKVGDLDGDQKGDVLVSANAAITFDLVVYAYSSAALINPAAGNPAPLFRMVIPEAGAASLASAGDADGDGVVDFMIGAWDFSDFTTNAGRLLVFSGNFTLGTQPQLLFQRNGSGGVAIENFAYGIAPLGDINNDGVDEILASSPNGVLGDKVFLFNKDSDQVF